MRSRTLVLAILALLTLTAGTAEARDRSWYVGAKIGLAEIDANGFDEATQGFVLFGYDILAFDAGFLAVEAEVSTTISEGDIETGQVRGEWEGDTAAAFAVYRTPGAFYFRAKAGVMYSDFEATVSSPGFGRGRFDDSDTDPAVGLGGGWLITENVGVEVEWTRAFFDDDVDFFTLGLRF